MARKIDDDGKQNLSRRFDMSRESHADVGVVKRKEKAIVRILFMGRKNVATEVLDWLSRIPDVEVAGVLTDGHLKGSSTHSLAQRLGYVCYTFEEALDQLRNGELVYDLGVSILYWRKLTAEFLAAPKMGSINFHPAPLPDYKGTGGYNFAILDKCASWGVSAHYMTEGIDDGPIIEVSRFAIDSEVETCVSLEKKSKLKLKDLITRVITKIVIDGEELSRLPNVGGRYITRREMEATKKIQPGDDIERKIRAFWFPPYDGAYIEIGRRRFTLVSKAILSCLPRNRKTGAPDQVVTDGVLVEIEGEKRVKSADDVDKKIRTFWCPPHDGAYVEMNGERFTLVNNDILSSLAPEGTTSLFTTHFASFDDATD